MIKEIRMKCNELKEKERKDIKAFLTRFNGKHGIVRCNNFDKDDVIRMLNSIKSVSNRSVSIKTLGTSGTIKALIKKQMDVSL